MENFKDEKLTVDKGFWVMWYFLKEHYDLSGGNFDISDILSAIEPVTVSSSQNRVPADGGMISFWNEAYEKFKADGLPPNKILH